MEVVSSEWVDRPFVHDHTSPFSSNLADEVIGMKLELREGIWSTLSQNAQVADDLVRQHTYGLLIKRPFDGCI